MAAFDWDSLDTENDWKRKLQELLTTGRTALGQADNAQLAEVEADLKEFIKNDIAYDALRDNAKAALGELLTADIDAIIQRIDALANQLPDVAGRALHTESFISARQLPRWRLAHAFSAVTALQQQQQKTPYLNAKLDQQMQDLLTTIQELLAEQPPASAKASARSKKASTPRRPAKE